MLEMPDRRSACGPARLRQHSQALQEKTKHRSAISRDISRCRKRSNLFQYQRQEVVFWTKEAPGTVIIRTDQRFLYVVSGLNRALRWLPQSVLPSHSHSCPRRAEGPAGGLTGSPLARPKSRNVRSLRACRRRGFRRTGGSTT